MEALSKGYSYGGYVTPKVGYADGGLVAAGGVPTIQNNIEIIDQRAGNSPEIESNELLGPNGQKKLQLIIRDAVKNGITSGQFDKEFGRNFGVNRQGRKS